MRWRGRRGSSNIEDRRTQGGGGAFGGGRRTRRIRMPRGGRTIGGGGRRVGGRGGAGGILGILAILAVAYFLGINPAVLLDGGDGGFTTAAPREMTEGDRRAGDFVSVVLADTEDIWRIVFADQFGTRYQPPILVLYAGQTSSPCGGASGATGPFYCPSDRKIYLDTDFFVTMERRLGATGDFAQAYVVAHEVAHHVQNEMGILGEANQVRRQVSEGQANEISVRIELQADCFSGIWARRAEAEFGSLEPGDVDEAMNAARSIGDDTLARNAGRTPMPHTFTHGTSEQRQRWFARGYDSGQVDDCDTWNTNRL